jgi:DNA-binding MarR family transcriptional regulator
MTFAHDSSDHDPSDRGSGPSREWPVTAADLRAALLRSVRRIRAESSGHELNDGQCSVLGNLDRHGAMTPRELADRDGVRPPSMTRVIAALDELGLVRRYDDPRDGRRVLIDLTETGAESVREIRRRRNAWLDQRLAALSEDDRAVLARATELLRMIAES